MLLNKSVLTIIFGFFIIGLVQAVALTINVAANENACFHVWSKRKGRRIGFYFSVLRGGAFDIDYKILAPNQDIVLEGHGEKEGDFVFTTTQVGEYSACFSNAKSTWTDKLVDFELSLNNEKRPEFTEPDASQPKVTKMEESMDRLNVYLTTIQRTQKHFKSKENRNSYIANSTESKIFWFAILESMAIIGMAAVQVFVIKSFFKIKRGSV